jgi:hypothetical protein
MQKTATTTVKINGWNNIVHFPGLFGQLYMELQSRPASWQNIIL